LSFLATSFVLIFHFENSHHINITLVFKAKTKNKIINPKTSIYLFTVPWAKFAEADFQCISPKDLAGFAI